MAFQAVRAEDGIGKTNEQVREELDQADLDLILESTQAIKFIGRALMELDEVDDVERGTVTWLLNHEANRVFEAMCSLETRLGS